MRKDVIVRQVFVLWLTSLRALGGHFFGKFFNQVKSSWALNSHWINWRLFPQSRGFKLPELEKVFVSPFFFFKFSILINKAGFLPQFKVFGREVWEVKEEV